MILIAQSSDEKPILQPVSQPASQPASQPSQEHTHQLSFSEAHQPVSKPDSQPSQEHASQSATNYPAFSEEYQPTRPFHNSTILPAGSACTVCILVM